MSLIGRRVVFTISGKETEGIVVDKIQNEVFCIETDNGDAHFTFYQNIISFVNKNEEPKTVRVMANSFYIFDVDFDYKDVSNIPEEGVKVKAKLVYYSVLDIDIIKNKLLLITKVEHKANGLVCVYVEPIND